MNNTLLEKCLNLAVILARQNSGVLTIMLEPEFGKEVLGFRKIKNEKASITSPQKFDDLIYTMIESSPDWERMTYQAFSQLINESKRKGLSIPYDPRIENKCKEMRLL